MANAAVLDGGTRAGGAGRRATGQAHGRDSAFRAARAHSKRVRVLRVLLPVLGALIAVGFAGFSWLMTTSNSPFKASQIGIVDGKLVMANPNLAGFTKDRRAYRISAERAIQNFGDLERIALEGISASLPAEGDAVAQMRAATGVFDSAANTLRIDSPLTIVTDDGMNIRLGNADIDMGSGTLRTDRKVDIDINGSRITSDSLTVEQNGKLLVFDNNVRMTLSPENLKRQRGDNAQD